MGDRSRAVCRAEAVWGVGDTLTETACMAGCSRSVRVLLPSRQTAELLNIRQGRGC